MRTKRGRMSSKLKEIVDDPAEDDARETESTCRTEVSTTIASSTPGASSENVTAKEATDHETRDSIDGLFTLDWFSASLLDCCGARPSDMVRQVLGGNADSAWMTSDNPVSEAEDHPTPAPPPRPTTYKPAITARYPLEDYEDSPLNMAVPQFCFTLLGDIIQPTDAFKLPTLHHFVLTDESGRKTYGTCLTIWTECDGPPSSATDNPSSEEDKKYIPTVLCLLSTWPYLTAFREYLAQLWRLSISTNIMKAPIERYIMNICREVPAPPPGAFEVRMTILDSAIGFWSPPANQPIAYVALPFEVLFQCLELENLLYVWYALTMERQILLVSSQASLLTVCAEILCSLLFPMQWSHLYIPLLPRSLTPMLDAPVPYLVGITSDILPDAKNDIGAEAIVVNLDTNEVIIGLSTPDLPPLPESRRNKLEKALERTAGDVFWNARGLTKKRFLEAKRLDDKAAAATAKAEAAAEKEKKEAAAAAVAVFAAKEKNTAPEAAQTEAAVAGQADAEAAGIEAAANQVNEEAAKATAEEQKKEEPSDVHPIIEHNQAHTEQLWKEGEQVWHERLSSFDEVFDLAYTPNFEVHANAEGSEKNQVKWDVVQNAFVRFFVAALRDYRKFLLEPDSSDNEYHKYDRYSECAGFNTEEFIKKQRSDYVPFLTEFCSTQMFDDFIIKRRGRPDVVFFDNSIEKKINSTAKRLFKSKVETTFLQSAQAHKALKIFAAVAPNSSNLPFDGPVDVDDLEIQRTYVYESFPKKLDESLFGTPRELPHMITAEFDRQALLVQKLRSSGADVDGTDIADRWDRSASPEVATFLLFFCIFVPTIARNEKLPSDNDSVTPSHVGDAPNTEWSFDEVPRPIILSSSKDDDTHVAEAELDLAFDVLTMMKERGLVISDAVVYHELIEACARCGALDRAKELMAIMNEANVVGDSEMLTCYMNAMSLSNSKDFAATSRTDAVEDVHDLGEETETLWDLDKLGAKLHDQFEETKTSFTESQKQMSKMIIEAFDSYFDPLSSARSSQESASAPSFASYLSGSTAGIPFIEPVSSNAGGKKNSSSIVDIAKKEELIVTDVIRAQLELGEKLLTFLYPDLSLDRDSDACPQCSAVIEGDEVISGWNRDPCDPTTQCSKCKHRFVGQFSVTTSSPAFEGSQGKSTTLYCENLSPWVLRKELENMVASGGNPKEILKPDWRKGAGAEATLWWNIILSFLRFRIPATFLLQGNFPQHRLINAKKNGLGICPYYQS